MTDATAAAPDTADLVAYELIDGVALITVDDGKANAISHAVLDGLHGALDRAEGEARAVVIAGRPGKFSAGFDLATMNSGGDAMRDLVLDGARFLMRLYGYGLPTVAACTGHALAAGALVLLASDTRIGADGPYKIGLNEVAIGMSLPRFAVELARERVVTREFTAATMQARIYDPTGAATSGFLDHVATGELVVGAAISEARQLGQIRTGAYALTKQCARQATIDSILANLESDQAVVLAPEPRP